MWYGLDAGGLAGHLGPVNVATQQAGLRRMLNRRASRVSKRPNILFIFTDQQSAAMMSCAGNSYLNTVAMDSLAARGVRFDRCYCTNPVCVPSRLSLMTGRMPSEIELGGNSVAHIGAIPNHILKTGLGWQIRQAGYDVAYGGKAHLPNMSPQELGFDCISDDEGASLAQTAAEYVSRERDRPFFLVASFINPHDICYMAIRDFAETDEEKRLLRTGGTELAALDEALRLPAGVSEEEFFKSICPPLPANYEPQKDEPEAIGELQAQRPFKKNARERWPARKWRLHRWAYCRLTEMVDRHIGEILKALSQSGKEAETVVIFSSDHGDMDSAHRMEHKTAFYEEACRVPLIVAQPDAKQPGLVDRSHLVSNGLDLLPTICDYAGAVCPADLAGMSLRPLVEGRLPESWRTFVPVENECGRMIVTDDFKYMLYDKGRNREQLIDIVKYPGEMKTVARDTWYGDVLHKHRDLFSKHFGNRREHIPDLS